MPVLSKSFFAKRVLVLAMCCCGILIYHCKNPTFESDYYNPKILATHDSGQEFVGSQTCMECHSDIYTSHLKTAHHRTSSIANDSTILGSFDQGSNILDLEYVRFTMESRLDTFYQHIEYKNRLKQTTSPFDVVIGSGVRGQSYLTWDGNKLFQLQASYYTPNDNWVNSPGFPTYAIERPVRDGCIKCHVTFAKNQNIGEGNQYDKSQMLYGIECERCHRPAAKHVTYHRKHPEAQIAKFMLRIDSLSRQQRLDVCAQCHSGPQNQQLKGNPFSFLTGENLSEYSRNMSPMGSSEIPDVHGNQYGLLTRSACFKQTPNMDCTTCHDPHKNQRGDISYFNQKCMECHSGNATLCSAHDAQIIPFKNNCISCHMPLTPSQSMTVMLNSTDSLETSFYIRTHLIKVYDKDSLALP